MRLVLDILIAAAVAIAAAALGMLVGLIVAIFVSFIFFRGVGSLGGGFLIVVFMGFCGLVSAVFAFPLCGIWLNERRQTLRNRHSGLPSSSNQRI